jgi:hypothetical protein
MLLISRIGTVVFLAFSKPYKSTAIPIVGLCTKRLASNFNPIVESNKFATSDYSIDDLQKIVSRLHKATSKQLSQYVENPPPNISPASPAAGINDASRLRERKQQLEALHEKLRNVTAKSEIGFASLIPELQILKIPLQYERNQIPQIPKEASKPKITLPRLPFFTVTSTEGLNIRVGRSARDNDELSCNPNYRQDNYWWLHASGCPGSHVVICCADDDLPKRFKSTLYEAAVLAADKSKATDRSKVAVTYTRCRNVSKPKNAAAGKVLLCGKLGSVEVNVQKSTLILENLMKTKNRLL